MGIKTWLINRRPSPVTLVASALVLAGFGLASLDWNWLALAAVGTFGPGLLREMGWVHDKDEFQMRSARRAGYHAYLVGGLFAFLMVGWLRSSDPALSEPGALVESLLIIIWFTYLLSSLFAFWGTHRTAIRILLVFGTVWLIFNLLAGEGNWRTSLMQSLLAVPFFLTAWLARRWPRVAGVLLLGAAAWFFHFFGLVDVFSGDPSRLGRIAVIVLFIGPLLASGVGLLQPSDRDETLQST